MCIYDETVPLSSLDGLAKVAFTPSATAEEGREAATEGPITVGITVKKTMEDTQDDLLESFHTRVHKFNINQQHPHCREFRKNCGKRRQ